MLETVVIEPAHPSEWPAALEVVFRPIINKEERELRVNNAVQLIHRGELDAAGILVARSGEQVLGAMVCLPIPGASGLLWPPQAISSAQQMEIEDRLLQFAISWLRQRGTKLAQALLAPAERHLGKALKRNGLTHITNLWYLRHNLRSPARVPADRDALVFASYGHCDRDLFHQTLLRTYEGTSDCPEVNGVRTLEEVLAGHRAQGVHNPERWWLALAAGQPAGVLLLTEIPEWHGWDVSYLGIVPEARRRGLGRMLTHKAIDVTRAARGNQLTLAVDARNRAAWDLYAGMGFEPYDQREVYLVVWNQAAEC
jgi:mycothiol synthase